MQAEQTLAALHAVTLCYAPLDAPCATEEEARGLQLLLARQLSAEQAASAAAAAEARLGGGAAGESDSNARWVCTSNACILGAGGRYVGIWGKAYEQQ